MEYVDCKNKYKIIGNIVKMYVVDSSTNEMNFTNFNKIHLNKISKYKWRMDRGYIVSNSITGKTIFMHHIILNFNKTNGLLVDHIDRNRKNNLDENLRITTFTENAINKGIQSNNTSGYPGVHFGKERQKWEASVKINGNKKHLGRFDTREEAIKARIKGERKYFGYVVDRKNDKNTIFK